MSLMSNEDQARLRGDFAALTRPVRLVFFTRADDCETCDHARQVLDELPALSDKITVEEIDFSTERDKAYAYGIDHVPAIAVVGQDAEGLERDSHIRFLGTPSGYEFISLLRAVLLTGTGESGLQAETRQRVAAVDKATTVHVFTTPTCPHCPRAVILAHEMAFLNPNITAYAVEATEYPDLARRFRVTGVPKTVVDDRIEILGALPEAEFVAQALGDAPTETLNPL
jgi:glutaredoxin-like protein